MTSNSRRSRQEEFEDSLVLYGDQMPEPSREPRLGRLTDARAMVRSLTAKGERRLAVALRGDAWTGPDLDDQLHLTAVTMAIAKKLGRDDSRLRELEGPTEHVDAAIHYVWWAWVRANMVATVDGSAVGGDGLTGSINTEIDRRTFQRLRASADVIVVGAGTARAEGYGPAVRPLVVVSASGALPDRLRDAPPERVRTEPGGDADALRDLVRRLYAEGCGRILVEGGPRLLGDLLRAGLVDEVCATVAPRLVAGDGARMVSGPDLDVPLELVGLIEEDGTLLCRWRVVR